MTNNTDNQKSTLDSLRIELAEIGDEIWNDHQATNLDDSDASARNGAGEAEHDTPNNMDPRSNPGVSAHMANSESQRPTRGTKFRTREEIFEHRMAVMAHRRAQLDAHRNKQARKWFAFTGALMFIGASGLGAFYHRTASDWKFLSTYSLDTSASQTVQTVPSAGAGKVVAGSSSSHFQNAALAGLPSVGLQETVEAAPDATVVEAPQQMEAVVEQVAKPVREPVAPAQPQKLAAPKAATPAKLVANLQPTQPAPKIVKPSAKKLVRVVPTAMPAAPDTVYNLNKAQTASRNAAASELIAVPAETETAQPAQRVASLSPSIITPKAASASTKKTATRPEPDEAAIETAISLPPKTLALGNSDLTEDKTSSGLLGSLHSSDGKTVSVLLERGDKLLLLGDIVSARQLYQHAFQQGNQRAAARIGTTYDPRIFAQLGVQGLQPNSELALDWYNKAVEAGDESAKHTAQSLSAQINKP